jgi:hypothetical protein
MMNDVQSSAGVAAQVEYALIVMVQGELSEEMSWLLASMFPRME